VTEKIRTLIADELLVDEDEVTPKGHLVNDLGGDSLDCIELIMQVETEFDIEIDDEEAEKAVNLETIVAVVMEKLEAVEKL